jgi:hypothetical protein
VDKTIPVVDKGQFIILSLPFSFSIIKTSLRCDFLVFCHRPPAVPHMGSYFKQYVPNITKITFLHVAFAYWNNKSEIIFSIQLALIENKQIAHNQISIIIDHHHHHHHHHHQLQVHFSFAYCI